MSWERHDVFPENECECVCGEIYRSHSKYDTMRGLIARIPCPKCKGDVLRASRGDWEGQTIK